MSDNTERFVFALIYIAILSVLVMFGTFYVVVTYHSWFVIVSNLAGWVFLSVAATALLLFGLVLFIVWIMEGGWK